MQMFIGGEHVDAFEGEQTLPMGRFPKWSTPPPAK